MKFLIKFIIECIVALGSGIGFLALMLWGHYDYHPIVWLWLTIDLVAFATTLTRVIDILFDLD